MWSHDVVSTSINLASDLKMGQYLKIPPRAMFITQVWGTILGEWGCRRLCEACRLMRPWSRCRRQLCGHGLHRRRAT